MFNFSYNIILFRRYRNGTVEWYKILYSIVSTLALALATTVLAGGGGFIPYTFYSSVI
jgi:hypothetical protein